jgi:hypothetical protein
MGPELSPGTSTVPSTRARRLRRADALALAALIALPVAVFGLPALLGHPVLPGDDLTQNFPLRELAGQQIHRGQLPLYDPYVWSGAPLLGGWNAAAAYPLTWLFAVFPGTAAWTLNMIITWAVAGLGTFGFLRALRLGSLPSLLGALSFSFAGAMPAQVAHFGLVAGMSWVPVQLLAVLRLTEGCRVRPGWIAVLATAFGLTMLAGEPRAVTDAGVIVVIYAGWRIVRLGRRGARAGWPVAAGLALGVALGAVQWLPGLAVIGTSQRGASTAALFNSGSLPHRWLLLMLVPDLLGGSGSFGQPAFFASYNLAEVTGYVGVLPLTAALVLLGRVRLRPRPPEWLVWHVLALVGLVLALGGNTPAGSLLAHLPLFDGQRLQSRNILVADLALAVLLAYWAERPFGSPRLLRLPTGRRIDLERAAGLVIPLAMVAVVVLGLGWGGGLLHWLRAGPAAPGAAGRLRPWLLPYALIAVGAIALVLTGPRLSPRLRSRWLASLVLIDLVVFTLLAVVAVAPGLGAGASPPAATSQPSQPSQAGRAAVPRPVGALGYPGRFAIYDPGELDAPQLPAIGAPDLNVPRGTPSVQGYSSTVDGRYAAVTGAHQALGQGQDVLDPHAVADGTLDQLDTSVLLTPPAYLVTTAGRAGPAPGPLRAGRRDVPAGHHATWFFAAPFDVARLVVPDADARQDAAAGTRIGLLAPDGATRWYPTSAPDGAHLAISPPHPVRSVAVVAQAGGRASHLGPASVTRPDGTVVVTDGQLQGALVPPRWGYAGHDGALAVFVDHFARGPLSLQARPGRPAPGASVRALRGPAAGPTMAAVSSPHGVRVIRAVAAIPGWSATWRPGHGPVLSLPVRLDGLVQAVDVPAGRGIVTWSYTPPRFWPGLAASLGAAIAVILVTGWAAARRRGRAVSATPRPSGLGERSHQPSTGIGSAPRAPR